MRGTSTSTGMYNSIILLLGNCTIDECEQIAREADARRYQLMGRTPSMTDRVEVMLKESSDPQEIKKVIDLSDARFNELIKINGSSSLDVAKRNALKKQLTSIIRMCDENIKLFLLGKNL